MREKYLITHPISVHCNPCSIVSNARKLSLVLTDIIKIVNKTEIIKTPLNNNIKNLLFSSLLIE